MKYLKSNPTQYPCRLYTHLGDFVGVVDSLEKWKLVKAQNWMTDGSYYLKYPKAARKEITVNTFQNQ